MTFRLMSSMVVLAFLAVTTAGAFAADAGAIRQQTPDQWRASKLAGLSVYGPGNKTVGKISDVLLSRDGKAEYVIIGVGGFLGIGEKDVAVPFDQVKFISQPPMPPVNPEPIDNGVAPAATNTMAGPSGTGAPNATNGGMASNGGIAPGTMVGLGTPADTTGAGAAPAMAGSTATAPRSAASMAHTLAYPDHSTIDMTAEQLKAAPSFKFAS